MENLYEILQCAPTATKDELRRSYTRLARKHHPDKKAQRESAVNNTLPVSGTSNHHLDCESAVRIDACSDSQTSLLPKHLDKGCPSPIDSFKSNHPEKEQKKRLFFGVNHGSVSDNSPARKDTNSDHEFVNIDKAWKILGDDDLRAQYDIMWKDRRLMQEHPVQEIVQFDDFDFSVDEKVFSYLCRCGGEFVLNEFEQQLLCDFVSCNTCSLIINVTYD